MTENLNHSFVLIDKPAGWTSFDAVNLIRKKARVARPNIKKLRVGHAGTLDPFATGLLIVGVGREATKKLDEFKELPKTYLATIRLGATSDTDDRDGKITPCHCEYPLMPIGESGYEAISCAEKKSGIASPRLKTARNDKPSVAQIKKTLKKFLGEQEQIPPMYSAKKIQGKKMYELARAGKTIERKPNQIQIYDIKLIDYEWPNLTIKINCSKGTYIRALARDIGEALGTGAYCDQLRRTKIGDYSVENAILPNDFHI